MTQGGLSSTPRPTATGSDLAQNLRPQETNGKVNKSSIGVKTIDNNENERVDYYTQYEGNGSVAAGWPSRMSWISFADM